ncbi:hypothetical protein ACYCVF_33070 [Bradyrhizobium sp. 1.29L]
MSCRADREPLKRQLDAAQAEAVGALVAGYLTHSPTVRRRAATDAPEGSGRQRCSAFR